MAFADRNAVIDVVSRLISTLWQDVGRPAVNPVENGVHSFGVLSYQEAMSLYGSDKPDLRYKMFPITQQPDEKPFPAGFRSMISSIPDPSIDFIKLDDRFDTQSIRKFLDSPAAAPFFSNPAGAPAVLVVDSSKPLMGLAPLGHEFADSFLSETGAEPGQTFILQARPKGPFYGGSTTLGDLRRELIKHGLGEGLVEKAEADVLAWIVDFPLFKPTDISEPGQGGSAGIQSTHHPFTAPRTAKDLDHILNGEPLKAIGDHYDLVINGIEVGGGSKRIHNSEFQEYILRDVLKVPPERVEDFRHLLDALRAGCPPHSGIALGFDRLMTILCDTDSVRDVIAFPKWGQYGEDKLVKAPAAITPGQMATYHLAVKE